MHFGSGYVMLNRSLNFISNVTDGEMHQMVKCTTICLAFLMRLHIHDILLFLHINMTVLI
jgi:hypothetical protein